MAAPIIDPIPEAGQPGDPKKVFDQKMYAHVSSLNPMIGQFNSLVTWLNENINLNIPVEFSGTSTDLDGSQTGSYIRATNSGTKTINVKPESESVQPDGANYFIRNIGAGDLTIEAGSGVTINGNAVLESGASVILQRVAADVWDYVAIGGEFTADLTALNDAIDERTVGPTSSAADQVALFDGITGKLLKAGQTMAQYLAAFLVTLYNIFPRTIATVADIAGIAPVGAGQMFNLKEYNAGTLVGGGQLVAVAGTTTPDNGVTFACAGAFHLRRVNFEVVPEIYGYANIYTMPDATLENYMLAGGLCSNAVGVAAAFNQKVLANQSNVVFLAMGDSTGNANDEWVYLTAVNLAAKYPTHSVQYHLWDTTSYFSSVAISTGTGVNTIHVYNASIPGATAAFFLGGLRPALYAQTPDLVIYNYGHNMGTAASYNQIFNYHVTAFQDLIQSQPQAEHVITIQNIDTEYPAYSELQAKAMRNIASVLGCGVIDIRTVFANKFKNGDITDWMGDLIHPNALGEKVWANIVLQALNATEKMPCFPINTLGDSEQTLVSNDHFYQWVWTDALPASYTINSYATALKDATISETCGFSVQLTSTGTSGQIGILTRDASGILSKLNKESGATFSARVRPSAGSSFNCGRVEVDLGGGVVVSSWPRTEPKSGWYWSSVYITATQLKAASLLRLSVYSGDTTDFVHVDRITINEGNLIKDTKFKPVTITQFYDPSRVVGKTTNDALTVVGNDISVVNTVDTYPGFGVNLTDLEIGVSYTATWSSSVAGANSGALIRSFGLQGAVQVYVTPLNTNTLTFTAIAESASIVFEILATASGTTFDVDDISIEKT